jgi:hypothetical protein
LACRFTQVSVVQFLTSAEREREEIKLTRENRIDFTPGRDIDTTLSPMFYTDECVHLSLSRICTAHHSCAARRASRRQRTAASAGYGIVAAGDSPANRGRKGHLGRMTDVIEAKPEGRTAPRISGFTLILVATAIAGVASYVVTTLVPFRIGFARYALFAVFWSSMYLVVGALGGIQQEVTRGTGPARRVAAVPSRARNFGLVAAGTVFAAIVATAPLWVTSAFPSEGWNLVWPLAVGTASFVVVAVIGGSLYGVAAWVPIALMICVDALLRLAAVLLVLVFTTNVVALAWAVAVPFPLSLVILWPLVRRSIVGRTELDVGYRALTWNVARTIAAAASTGVMVSGFPLLLGLTSSAEPPVTVGLYILTITLTRAPLIIVAMSLQNYFLVIFRDHAAAFWRYFLQLQGIVLGGGIVLALAGWWIGPSVFGYLYPAEPRPDGAFIAVLVLSSALVGSMCVTAPAVLARSRHVVLTAGWISAAVATIGALLLPVDFTTRTLIALVGGPIIGLLVHGGYLALVASQARRSPEPS